MAHIPDGVLTMPVLLGGGVVSAAGTWMGLRRIGPERMPQVAVLSAVFFVASLVHLPAGLASVHLLLNGLMGVVLGMAAYPAIMVALLLQAVLFGFGGLAVLGVNAANMAVPALLAGWLFRRLRRPGDFSRRTALAAGSAGGGAVAATALLVAGSLALSGQDFLPALTVVAATAAPVMVVEAVFTAAAIGLLARVRPELLEGPP
jgi:cobalt/nickel transport system permease protein